MESTFLEHDLSSYFFLVLLPNYDKLGGCLKAAVRRRPWNFVSGVSNTHLELLYL